MAFHFAGFSAPNGTFVPDEVFDVLAPELSEAELRVLLYIIRRTFGFKKNTDDISLKQMTEGIRTREGRVLDRGAGLSKAGNVRGIRGLIEKGIVIAKRNRTAESGDQATTYTLRFKNTIGAKGDRGEQKPQASQKQSAPQSENSVRQAQIAHLPVSTKETGGCLRKRQGGVYVVDTQQTVLQETDVNLSNIRRQPAAKLKTKPSELREKTQTHLTIDRPSSFEEIGTVLLRTRPQELTIPKPQARTEAPSQEVIDAIRAYISETAQMFDDQASLNSSTSRAIHLYQKSNLSLSEFLSRLYETRSLVKERRDKVKGQVNGHKKMMAYWFAFLEDHLGLRSNSRRRYDSPRRTNVSLPSMEGKNISTASTSSPARQRGEKYPPLRTHSFKHTVVHTQSKQSLEDAQSATAAPS